MANSSVVHHDDEPIRPVHPARVAIRILRNVINDRSPPQDLDILRAPNIQPSENDCAAGEVNRLVTFDVDVLVINARTVVTNSSVALSGWIYL